MNKYFLIVTITTCFYTSSIAQQQPSTKTEINKTKLEAFVAQSGVVIVKGISQIGKVEGLFNTSIEVDSKEFTNPATGKRESGVTINVKRGGSVERESTSYVDYDEIESLIKGLDYISKIDKSSTKLDLFEATYRTKGDLEFTVFSQDNGKIGFSIVSGRISSVTSFFNQEKIETIRNVIAQAKVKLDSIKQ